MAKIEVTKTELVWPGKYNEDGTRKEVPRVSLSCKAKRLADEKLSNRWPENDRKHFSHKWCEKV
jgi:hypothetical protein